MRLFHGTTIALAALTLIPAASYAQDESSRAVAGGGISIPGWAGKIDANEEKAGKTVNDAKLAQKGKDIAVTTGPAVAYWNPANKASGNYTVKATFNEPKYM